MSLHCMPARWTAVTLLLTGSLLPATAGPPASPPAAGAKGSPAQAGLVQKVYPVGDLVLLPEDSFAQGRPKVPGKGTGQKAPAHAPQTEEARLMELITGLVEPRTWDKQGGPGSIQYHPEVMALSVRQTPDVQEQVEDLLAALRRLQGVNVAVDVRFVRLPPWFLERLDLDGGAGEKKAGAAAAPTPGEAAPLRSLSLPAFLGEGQVRRFLEAVQGDRRAVVLQSPRLMVSAGQVSTISLLDRPPSADPAKPNSKGGQDAPAGAGFRLSVQPVVSADRRSVRLSLAVELTDRTPGTRLAVPPSSASAKGGEGKPVAVNQTGEQPGSETLALRSTLTILDGATVLLGGWSRQGEPVPRAGEGSASDQVFLLVTPRIIIPEEEETRQPAAATRRTP